MLGPFATASRRTPIHQVSLLHTATRTPPAHRCPRRQRQRRQRQRVTEGTAMAQWQPVQSCQVKTADEVATGVWMRKTRRRAAARCKGVLCCAADDADDCRWVGGRPARWSRSLLLRQRRRVHRRMAEPPASRAGHVHVRQLRTAVRGTVARRQAYWRRRDHSHWRSVSLSLSLSLSHPVTRRR